jgi:hypothetical protein
MWYLQADGVPADAGTDVAAVALSVEGGYEGVVGEPDAALTVVDRDLPRRADTPEGAELAGCLPVGAYADPDLWIPVARHDVGGAAPRALIARIGDLAAGYCVQDPVGGPSFVGAPLPAPSGDPLPAPVVVDQGSAAAVLLTAPPGVSRLEVASEDRTRGPVGCTIADGLAICTLDNDPNSDPGGGPAGRAIVVTAFTAAAPQGVEVYRG